MLITDQKSRSYGTNNNGDMNKTDLSKVGNVPSTVLETPARECVNLDRSRMTRYAYLRIKELFYIAPFIEPKVRTTLLCIAHITIRYLPIGLHMS